MILIVTLCLAVFILIAFSYVTMALSESLNVNNSQQQQQPQQPQPYFNTYTRMLPPPQSLQPDSSDIAAPSLRDAAKNHYYGTTRLIHTSQISSICPNCHGHENLFLANATLASLEMTWAREALSISPAVVSCDFDAPPPKLKSARNPSMLHKGNY